jgi:hypothetical protein
MDFLMADGAVLESRRPQVVERWRHDPQGHVRVGGSRQIGVTLEADQAHFLARQHPRIRRAVRLVTAPATFKTHHRMLEAERTAFIPMTVETSWFIRGEYLRHCRPHGAVRIMAIDAGHRAFRQFVVVGPLKLRPDIDVTARALLVDRRSFASHQAEGPIGMNLVTCGAGHLVLDMAALQAANVRRLVEMARETAAVHFRGGEFGGIADVGGAGAFRVLAARTVARFTRARFPTALFVFLDGNVRVLLESLVDVFVAYLTGFGTYVRSRLTSCGRGLILRRRGLARYAACEKKNGRRDRRRSREVCP